MIEMAEQMTDEDLAYEYYSKKYGKMWCARSEYHINKDDAELLALARQQGKKGREEIIMCEHTKTERIVKGSVIYDKCLTCGKKRWVGGADSRSFGVDAYIESNEPTAATDDDSKDKQIASLQKRVEELEQENTRLLVSFNEATAEEQAFISHIKQHLIDKGITTHNGNVVCKICNKTVPEIYKEGGKGWFGYNQELQAENESLKKTAGSAVLQRRVKELEAQLECSCGASDRKSYYHSHDCNVVKRDENNTLRERLEELETALGSVIKSDKTLKYEYERNGANANNLGEFPPSGERWLTPREIAKAALGEPPKTSAQTEEKKKVK